MDVAVTDLTAFR